jgi:hypothetical protein
MPFISAEKETLWDLKLAPYGGLCRMSFHAEAFGNLISLDSHSNRKVLPNYMFLPRY